jgi:hypothetical protein
MTRAGIHGMQADRAGRPGAGSWIVVVRKAP